MTPGTQAKEAARSSPLTIYPDYCHDISPTILKWCPLRARDVHALRDVGVFLDGRKLFHYGNHPVKWVRVVGVVVAVDEYLRRRVYTLDDGSGKCIECACVAPSPSPLPSNVPSDQGSSARVNQRSNARVGTGMGGSETNIDARKEAGTVPEGVENPTVPWGLMDVGRIVKVKGRVGVYWDVKQVDVVRVEMVGSTDGEVKHWDDAVAFKKDVLTKPWVVSQEEEAKWKRRREREQKRERRSGKGTEVYRRSKLSSEVCGNGRVVEKNLEKARGTEKMDQFGERNRKNPQMSSLRAPELKRKIVYPSKAVREAAAGKYDALGI